LEKLAISAALPLEAACPPIVLGFNHEAPRTYCSSLPNFSTCTDEF